MIEIKGLIKFSLTRVCEKTSLQNKYTHNVNSLNGVWFLLLNSMQFIQGNNRHQTYFTTPDEQVGADNAVRLIDAFIDKLDVQQLGFTGTVHKSDGRPPICTRRRGTRIPTHFSHPTPLRQ